MLSRVSLVFEDVQIGELLRVFVLTDPKGCSVGMVACELAAKTEDSTVISSVMLFRKEAEAEVVSLVRVTYPTGLERSEDGTEVSRKPWVRLTDFDVNT